MKRLWQIHLWFALLTIISSANAAEAFRQHYLFVVDTSRNMAPLAASARNAVYDLLDSGIQGQIQPGDTFEVWMFDADVRTNSFSRRLWVTGNNNANAVQAADLLRKQNHSRQANFTKAAEAIGAAIRAQPVSTVFIITDGRTALTNLPFATAINNIYREHSATLRGELRPFITTLVADSGQWVAWSVGSGGRLLEIPRVTLPPPKPEKPPVVATQTPPPKKAVVEETKPAPVPQPAPVVTTHTPAPTPAVVESKPVTPTPIEPAKPVTPVVVETKPEATPTPIVTPTTSPAPAPTPVLPPREEPKPVAEKNPVAKLEPTPPVTFAPAPAPAETAKPAATPPPAAKIEPTPSVTPAPAPVVVEAPQTEHKPTPSTGAITGVITPIPPKSAANNSYLLVAVGLIGLATVLLFLYLRPKPRTKGASLITRSLDRSDK